MTLVDAASLVHAIETGSHAAQRITLSEARRWNAFLRQPSLISRVNDIFVTRAGILQSSTFDVVTFREPFDKVFLGVLEPCRLTRLRNFPNLSRTWLQFPCTFNSSARYEDRLVYWYERPHATNVWNVEMAQWLWSVQRDLHGEPQKPTMLCACGTYKDLLAMFHPMLQFSTLTIALDITRSWYRRQSFPERLERICTRSGLFQFLHRVFDSRPGLQVHSLTFDFRHVFCSSKYTGDEPGKSPIQIETIPLEAVAEMPRTISPGSWHSDVSRYPDRMTDEQLIHYLSLRTTATDLRVRTLTAQNSSQHQRGHLPELHDNVELIGSEELVATAPLDLGDDQEIDVNDAMQHDAAESLEDGETNSDLSSSEYYENDDDLHFGAFVPRYSTRVDWEVFDDFSEQLRTTCIVAHLNCEDMHQRALFGSVVKELGERAAALPRITLARATFGFLDSLCTPFMRERSLIQEISSTQNNVLFQYKSVVDLNRKPRQPVLQRFESHSKSQFYFEHVRIFDLADLFDILYSLRKVAIAHIELTYTDRLPVAVWKFQEFLTSLADRGLDLRMVEALVAARNLYPQLTPTVSFDALYRIDATHEDDFQFADDVLQRMVDEAFRPCTLRVSSNLIDDIVYDCDDYTHGRIVLSLFGDL